MARPIEGIAPFRGNAARWLTNYLKTTRPDPAKAEQAHRDKEIARHIRPLSYLCKSPNPDCPVKLGAEPCKCVRRTLHPGRCRCKHGQTWAWRALRESEEGQG